MKNTTFEQLKHIQEYETEFISIWMRSVEEFFQEYDYKYNPGELYMYVCSDLGIDPITKV